MDIAAMSMINARQNIQAQASISMLKRTMESEQSQASQLLQMLPPSNSGNIIDVRA